MTRPIAHRRLRSLDGLRGVAASVVVVYHVLLASVPVFSALALGLPAGHLTRVEWVLTRTPLRILWAGPEFVMVFFVLSGFVLTRAIDATDWSALRAYYPSRLIRLYVPVWGALALAVGLHFAVNHHAIPGATVWLNKHDEAVHGRPVAQTATLLISDGDSSTTTVLWSLRWEVIFSLCLPLAILTARRLPALLVLLVSAAVPVVFHGGAALFLPSFVVGSVVAIHEPRIAPFLVSRRKSWLLGVLAVAGLTCDWWISGSVALGAASTIGRVVADGITVGAVCCVLLALHAPKVRDLLERRPAQWLGTRSYSLYLVHEPIVVSVAFLLGAPGWALLAIVGVPLALAATEAFFWLVERPSHSLARRSARRMRRAGAPSELRVEAG